MDPRGLFAFVSLAVVALPASPLRAQATDTARMRTAAKERVNGLKQRLVRAADSGDVMYALALESLTAGRRDEALDWLKQLTRRQEGWDPLGDHRWRGLLDDPSFRQVAADLEAANPLVHRSETALTLRERDLVPDGLGYDPVEGAFYMGSMARRKIVKISRDGAERDFIAPRQDGIFRVGSGMRVDTRTRTLWVTADQSDSTGVFHYDLRTGTLVKRYVVAAPGRSHAFNDLILDRQGTVYITDTPDDRVYRITRDADRLERLEPVLPHANGIALSPDERRLYVATFDGGVSILELATGTTHLLGHPAHMTLAGIDGLYCIRHSLIAVQNNIGWPRVVRFDLDSAGDRVVRMDVLESRNPLFFGWGATTGVVIRDSLYYVANTQIWKLVNDRIEAPESLTPIQILKVSLH